MAQGITELTAEQVRQACDPGQFSFRSTEELSPLEEVIGQERALNAIAFGIDIKRPGYHMYALGPVGTGKTTTVQKYLEHEAASRPVPDDWLYVNNFANEDKPHAFRLPAGSGCRLKADMDRLVDELQSVVPRIFESTEYTKQQEEVGGDIQKKQQAMLQEVDDFARGQGLVIMQTPQGLMIAPAANGNILTPEQAEQLDEEKKAKIEQAREEVEGKLRDAMRKVQQLQREARERVNDLDRQSVAFAVDHMIDELKERYAQFEPVVKLMDEIRKDILENVPAIKQLRQMKQMQEQVPWAGMMAQGQQGPAFDKYRVNLIVDNCESKGAPVIVARNPSYHNMVGRVEHQGQFGMLVTNFTMIKAGLLHKANGGYLMLDVRDVLSKPMAYEGLKRSLKNGVVEIEPMGEAYGLIATHTLEPEPIPLDIKVVLLGEPMLYYLLFAYDPDFQELFKVKVDFSLRMERTPETMEQYARFIATVCREEGLKHFDPSGVAKVVEHGSRLINHQGKLITKFGDIVDLVRQASFWAEKNGHELITGDDVKKAIDEHVYRSNQIEELLNEAIAEGIIMIDVEGEKHGQINGLAVMSLGDYAFGKPSRITASIHVGNEGVVNIDREVKIGGRIHNKGAMILASYLGGRYATDVPLALSAHLTFEQVYEEIEGDSASSTELYALLSGLSGFPIRQDLAVTGSVNQYGQVQAIGGVNQKIEGYFDICRLTTGLTGRQGVLIPRSNVKHLMLREDVVQAIREGKFHIYPVATIDEGISILTGKAAGEMRPNGAYPEGTVNAAVYARLSELAYKVKGFLHPNEKGEEEEPPEQMAA
jgi:lon-related putative ATP-dependent protease